MGTKATNQSNMRKLQATGQDGESYAITLPKELVLELKWRKGQKLSVTKAGRKLIVQDWT